MSTVQRQGVARPGSAADSEAVLYRLRHEFLAQPHGLQSGPAQGEMGCDCRRQNTARAVCIAGFNAGAPQVSEVIAVEEQVCNLMTLRVPTLY